MKIIVLILWISLGCHQVSIAQYDNPLLPYLFNCEDTLSKYHSRKEASDKKLIYYIYTTLNYPDFAKSNQIEGMVVVSFLIKKDGWIDPNSIKLLRDIGHGCGEEALKIVHSFNEKLGQWSFYDKPIDVRYNLPIRFRLN